MIILLDRIIIGCQKSIKTLATARNGLVPGLNFVNNAKTRVAFDRSYKKQDEVFFSYKNVVNLFIVYELNKRSRDLHTKFNLRDCLSKTVKLAKHADPDKHFYSRYGNVFNPKSLFIIPNFNCVKHFIISGVDNNLSTNSDNKKKIETVAKFY